MLLLPIVANCPIIAAAVLVVVVVIVIVGVAFFSCSGAVQLLLL